MRVCICVYLIHHVFINRRTLIILDTPQFSAPTLSCSEQTKIRLKMGCVSAFSVRSLILLALATTRHHHITSFLFSTSLMSECRTYSPTPTRSYALIRVKCAACVSFSVLETGLWHAVDIAYLIGNNKNWFEGRSASAWITF